MSVIYVPFTMAYYDAVVTLWRETPGVGLSAADEPERIAAYLERNPGMSFVALDGNRVVGALLAGHDGRRGYLHHLAVDPAYRHQGIGRCLVEQAEAELIALGIDKAHLFIFETNSSGKIFWERLGWRLRRDIAIMSKNIGGRG